MIRNRMDTTDLGYSENERLRQAGFRARDGAPRNFRDFAYMVSISPSFKDYHPKVRSVVDVSTKPQKERLQQNYQWWDKRITYSAIFNAIRDILSQTFRRMVDRGHDWIDLYVPKATGQLRESLKKQLHSPINLQEGGTKLLLRIGSYVHYLKYVALMSEKNLQHEPPQRRWVNYYGPPRWVVLDDPNAQRFFFMKLIMFMRRVIREELARSIMQVANRLGWPQFWLRQEIYTEDKN